jgi:glycosyltransferase involved in cell wall biosynthesis
MQPNYAVKIRIVTPYFYPAWEYGGTPRAAFELARSVAARGHEVRVLTTGPATTMKLVDGTHIVYCRNVSDYLAHKHRLFMPIAFRKELGQILQNCDILHIHEFRSTLTVPAARMARELSIPYVISLHGGLPHLGKAFAKRVFDRFWGNSILEHAAGVLVLSSKEKAAALAFGVEESRIQYLPNAIDVSEYDPMPAPHLFRKRWNLSAAKTILFVGRLNPIKGIDVLVEAFLSLRGDGEDIQLVLAGPDEGAAGSIPRRDDIRLTGYLDQQAKLEAFAAADVVVLPSRSEASPVVLFEALLCRRPAIVSSACELPMLRPEAHGVLQFESLNTRELRNKLLFALTDAHLSDNAAVGRDFAMREFSPKVVAEKAERIYEEAVFQKSRLPQM